MSGSIDRGSSRREVHPGILEGEGHYHLPVRIVINEAISGKTIQPMEAEKLDTTIEELSYAVFYKVMAHRYKRLDDVDEAYKKYDVQITWNGQVLEKSQKLEEIVDIAGRRLPLYDRWGRRECLDAKIIEKYPG